MCRLCASSGATLAPLSSGHSGPLRLLHPRTKPARQSWHQWCHLPSRHQPARWSEPRMQWRESSSIKLHKLAAWSSGMILASGARGPGFKSPGAALGCPPARSGATLAPLSPGHVDPLAHRQPGSELASQCFRQWYHLPPGPSPCHGHRSGFGAAKFLRLSCTSWLLGLVA